MTEDSRYRCFKCGVSFRIADPAPNAERQRCPEANCFLAFWAAKRGNTVAVGIYPDELAA